MGRGKIGDIVLSRSNGQQISRVRNRKPKNPRTNSQCIQRAVMATVMQAYSAGKSIFDHSFEGKSVGQQNMSEFLRLNAKMLRARLGAEFDTVADQAECYAKVNGPGVKMPVPNTYIISRGSLVNNIMTNNGEFINQPISDETIAQWVARNGIERDTLITFVFINAADAVETPTAVVFKAGDAPQACNVNASFGYIQLRAKTSAFTSDTAITAATPISDIFDFSTAGIYSADLATITIGDGLVGDGTLFPQSNLLGTCGTIVSRENSGLRSNCTMTLFDSKDIDEQLYGITWSYLLEAWQGGGQTIGDSDLILEGSGF